MSRAQSTDACFVQEKLRRNRYKLDSCVLSWSLHDGKKKGTEEVVSVFVLDVAAGARAALVNFNGVDAYPFADTAAHEIDVCFPLPSSNYGFRVLNRARAHRLPAT